MSNFYLIGFIQTIFLAILILTKKKLKLSDVWLTLFILIMGLRLLFIYFGELNLYESKPQLVLMEFIYWPLFGPLLYLYISTITSEDQKFKMVYLIHFLPAFVVFAAFSGYIAESGNLYFHEYTQRGIFFQIGIYVWYYTTHIYFIFCIIKLHRYRQKIKHYFSFKKNVDLKWMMILTYGFGAFLFTSLFFILTRSYINIEMPEFVDHLTWLIMVGYIFGIAFLGYKQKGIFRSADNIYPIDNNSTNEPREGNHKSSHYAKSKLNEIESNEIQKRLLNYMIEKKPYLNCELDIRILAKELNTSPHKLSQVINSNLHKNFFEFVNEYRVEEAKQCLLNPQYNQEKIMAVAYDCGFNSKSSFFSVFKKYTSQTPAVYKSQHLMDQ